MIWLNSLTVFHRRAKRRKRNQYGNMWCQDLHCPVRHWCCCPNCLNPSSHAMPLARCKRHPKAPLIFQRHLWTVFVNIPEDFQKSENQRGKGHQLNCALACTIQACDSRSAVPYSIAINFSQIELNSNF